MPSEPSVLIFGASARAAAFSALRAGLRPWCADLFGDADLRACCPVWPVPPSAYPQGFIETSRQAPPGPWLYTGGLENRRALVRRLERERPLWGNGAAVLRRVRSPRRVGALLEAAGLPCPAVRFRESDLPRSGRWLVKPLAGAGGSGIHFWTGTARQGRTKRVYYQEFIEGAACAAVYVGNGRQAQLLGGTRQLTGLTWLHARPFAYCGSIGPLPLGPALRWALARLGNVLTEDTGVCGIFGVDFILRDGIPWPVEVNPRYTASVEVLEHALGFSAVGLHRQVFDAAAPREFALAPAPGEPPTVIGKAIWFAPAPLVFPAEGPWRTASDPWKLPAFADIPRAGQRIETGWPIFTVFTRAASGEKCLNRLRQIASDSTSGCETTRKMAIASAPSRFQAHPRSQALPGNASSEALPRG